MSLPYRVKTLADVADARRALYREDPAGGFVLDVEVEDFGPLKRAVERERAAHEATKRELAQLQADVTAAIDAVRAEAGTKSSADAEATLNSTWSKRLGDETARLQSEGDAQVASLSKDLDRVLVAEQAQRIVGALAIPGSAAVLLPHVESRLRIVIGADGKRAVGVVDERGEPSTLTTDALAEVFRRDSTFAPVLRDGEREQAAHMRKVRESTGELH